MPKDKRASSSSSAELSNLDLLEAMTASLPGNWSINVLSDDGSGLRVFLMPEEGDRFASSFHVEQVAGGWCLSSHRWDRFEAETVYANLVIAIQRITAAADAAAAVLGSTRLN